MDQISPPAATASPELRDADWPSPRVAWYAVFVFSLSLMVNFLDRGILTLLVEPLKRDLHLSDTQISLVMGFAFVVFYAILGLPIARMVDTKSRRVIIGIGLAIWALTTAACGLATGFAALFLFRILVGVGEACTGPATFSMLADLFPPARLPRAIAMLNFGFITGNGLALLIGGAVIFALTAHPVVNLPLFGPVAPWRLVFFAVGLPGLLVALLMATVPEPARRGRIAGDQSKPLPLSKVVAFVVANRAVYVPLLGGLALNTILSFGYGMWVPAFYIRTFGWTPGQVGLISGLVYLLVWPLGAVFGSRLAEWLAARGRADANMRVVALAMILTVPGSVIFPLIPNATAAVVLSAALGFVHAWVLGPQNAAIQIITPNEMRGQVTALFLFVFNVIGFGFGATVVALLTDHVFGGASGLKLSLATAAATLGPLAAVVIWWGLPAYGAAVERARTWE